MLDKALRFISPGSQNPRRLLLDAGRLRLLRIVLPLAVLLLVAAHQALTAGLFGNAPSLAVAFSEWLIYGLGGAATIWFGLGWMAQAAAHEERNVVELKQASAELAQIQQRLASIHEVGFQAATAMDLTEVFRLAALAPVHIAGAGGAAVVTFDDNDRLNLEMTWGLSDPYVHLLQRRVEQGIPAERCRGCAPLTARVASDCPLFEYTRSQAQADGLASLVCLPLAHARERVGVIAGYFTSPDGPPAAHLTLLNIAAAGITSALEGARLRARLMAALATVGQAAPDPNLDTFLDQVLAAILQGWEGEAGTLLIYDSASATWSHQVQRGLEADPADPRLELVRRVSEQARASGQPALWSADASTPMGGWLSAVAVPLRAEGETLGALFLAASRPQAWIEQQLPLLDFLASQTALAVRNAQLHHQLGHMAVLEERHRLSREMHDGLAQTLSYLGWQMDRLAALVQSGRLEPLADEIAEARRSVREACLDVREAIDGLRLAVNHPGGLCAALQEYVADFSTRSGVATEFEASGGPANLSPMADLHLLRIAQEALTNVRKHSGAQHARVQLNCNGKQVELCIGDDGNGFDALSARRHHWGMTTMRERAQQLGGHLTVASGQGDGTRITATLPVIRMNTEGVP